MSTPTSGRKGEPSGVTGSGALVGEVNREAQDGSPTQPQGQAQEDGPSNSGELTAILDDFGT